MIFNIDHRSQTSGFLHGKDCRVVHFIIPYGLDLPSTPTNDVNRTAVTLTQEGSP